MSFLTRLTPDTQEVDRPPFVNALSNASAQVKARKRKNGEGVGEGWFATDEDDFAVALEVLPIAPYARLRSMTTADMTGNRDAGMKRECFSNMPPAPKRSATAEQLPVPITFGKTLQDPRTGMQIYTDPSLPPNQAVSLDSQNLRVGGCSVCPLSQFLTIDTPQGKKTPPPPCKEQALFLLYVLGGWTHKRGIQTDLSVAETFAERGADPELFELEPWKKLVAFTARSYTLQSLTASRPDKGPEGGYKHGGNEINAVTYEMLMEGYSKPRNLTGSAEFLRSVDAVVGMPVHLTVVVDANGNQMSIPDAIAKGEPFHLAGLRTIRMTIRVYANFKKGTNQQQANSVVVHFQFPSDDSPIILLSDDEWDEYATFGADAEKVQLVEMMGWEYRPTTSQMPQLPAGGYASAGELPAGLNAVPPTRNDRRFTAETPANVNTSGSGGGVLSALSGLMDDADEAPWEEGTVYED